MRYGEGKMAETGNFKLSIGDVGDRVTLTFSAPHGEWRFYLPLYLVDALADGLSDKARQIERRLMARANGPRGP